MTTQEFSDIFTTMLYNYSRNPEFGNQSSQNEILLSEYEKSVFLTKAQEELIISCYNGKNNTGDYFEATEEVRRQLDSLVKTKVYTQNDKIPGTGIDMNSVFFQLPDDIAYITLEQIIYNDSFLKCYNGKRVNVFPVKQDEYNKIKNNPFKGVTKYKALRLDAGNGTVEIISKYNIGNYIIRYVSIPDPIILEDLPNGLSIDGKSTVSECKLNPILHKTILEKAVIMALRIKEITMNK